MTEFTRRLPPMSNLAPTWPVPSEAPLSSTIRIALADDHSLFRDGLRGLLETEADFDVVGEAEDGLGAVALCGRTLPDVLLLDVEMPGPGAVEVVRAIRTRAPETGVIMVTMHDNAQLISQLLALGVRGYMLKNVKHSELVSVVRGAVHRQGHVALSVSAKTFLASEETDLPDPLSNRERQVLEFAAQALSNGQIATRLGISEATVKRHLYNIFSKLDAVSRLDAVNKYYGAERRERPHVPRH